MSDVVGNSVGEIRNLGRRRARDMVAQGTSAKLRRSDLSEPGIRRRRRGKGFSYLGPDSAPVTDAAELARIRNLVIPPAWQDVWICSDSRGHIHAVGTDSAGRRQYRYHALWREVRDAEKHDRMLEFGTALPKIRQTITRHLEGNGLSRERVLATAVRLIDLGFFLPGGEEYAAENGSYGLATILRKHVTCARGQVTFEYPAKGSKHREQAIADPAVCAVVRSLRRRKHGGDELLAYRSGTTWHDVTAEDINDYLREISGGEFSAKNFRTWHATVLAAVGLAVSMHAASTDAAALAERPARLVWVETPTNPLLGSGRYRARSRRFLSTWAILRRWRAPRTSTRA
jgi:DNA topoisomerase IB